MFLNLLSSELDLGVVQIPATDLGGVGLDAHIQRVCVNVSLIQVLLLQTQVDGHAVVQITPILVATVVQPHLLLWRIS